MNGTNGISSQKRKSRGSGATPKKVKIGNNLNKSEDGITHAKGKTPNKQKAVKTPTPKVKIADENDTEKKNVGQKSVTSPKKVLNRRGTPAKGQAKDDNQTPKTEGESSRSRKRKYGYPQLVKNVMENKDLEFTLEAIETSIEEIKSCGEQNKSSARKLLDLENLKLAIIEPTTSLNPKVLKQKTTEVEEDTETHQTDDSNDENGEEDIDESNKVLEQEDSGNEKKENAGAEEKEEKKSPFEPRKKWKVFKVYVTDFAFGVTKSDFAEHFATCGKIKSISLPINYTNGCLRGFCIVELETEEAYEKALALHQSDMKGREINVFRIRRKPFYNQHFKGRFGKPQSFGRKHFEKNQ